MNPQIQRADQFLAAFESERHTKQAVPRTVDIIIDRPMGTYHPDRADLYYPINYGYAEGILGGDGEEQDVYLLNVDKPLKQYKGARVVAIIHRLNDNEDKWVAIPPGTKITEQQIIEQTNFVEKYFKIELHMM